MKLFLTGDVNLHPELPPSQKTNYTFVWGDMLDIVRKADLLAINHESTLAEIQDNNPNTIQFEGTFL